MSPTKFYGRVLLPGLQYVETVVGIRRSPQAACFLLAVMKQESDLTARYQNSPSATPGPARGFAQFEAGGGVAAVINHPSTKTRARLICSDLEVLLDETAIWRALEGNDQLAVAFARLLMWTDPAPIPTTENDVWTVYTRLWRPGKPDRGRWTTSWMTAETTVYPPGLPDPNASTV